MVMVGSRFGIVVIVILLIFLVFDLEYLFMGDQGLMGIFGLYYSEFALFVSHNLNYITIKTHKNISFPTSMEFAPLL